MSSRLVQVTVLSAIVAALALPATSGAGHVGISAGVSATLKSLSPSSATLEVSYSITCTGVSSDNAQYFGTWNLVDVDTGAETFLGGVAGPSSTSTPSVSRGDRDRRIRAHLHAACGDSVSAHGSEFVDANSEVVLIPKRDDGAGGGGGGGNGGGGGGGAGGGGSDDPLGPGGCATELRGSNAPDELEGGAAGELILALGGADKVRGGEGHDCLVGGAGGDRLRGEDGNDRLTGDSGADVLSGGPGRNGYDAGSGNDRVEARNGRREVVRCGSGDDTARVDSNDQVRGCETVRKPS